MSKKMKLTKEQKDRLETLERYLEANECWAGKVDLKDLMHDGRYMVLGVRAPVFNIAVGCESIENAQAVCDFNPDSHSRVLDLDTGKVLWEEEKGWMPRKKKGNK